MKNLDSILKQLHESASPKRILDIGGWFAPCKQATHMIDLMPFETLNRKGAYGFGDLLIQKENYHQMDLGEVDRLPFEDRYFDFVICRHTLEDIKDPIKISKEMMRVAKAGYIETPHRFYESTKGVERPWWCGHYHHRWLVEIEDNKIIFQFKPHNLHSSRKFYFRRYPWQKVREAFKNTSLLWEGSFEVEERLIFEYQDVKKSLQDYKNKMRDKSAFRFRWQSDDPKS